MYHINLYNDKYIKRTLPDDKVQVPPGLKYIKGREYILEGTYENGFFMVQELFEAVVLSFTVKNILFTDNTNNYCLLLGSIISYQNNMEIPPEDKPMIKGNFYNVYKDATYDCEGYWFTDKKKRLVFKPMAYTLVKDASVASMEAYLTDTLKGLRVGPKTIKKILDTFDIKCLSKIKDDAPEFSLIVKNSAKRELIRNRLIESEESEKAVTLLLRWGFSMASITSILNDFGTAAYSRILSNPNYLLKFTHVNVKSVDKISKNNGFTYDNPLRVTELIKRYIQNKEKSSGDIYVNYKDFISSNYTNSFNEYVSSIGDFDEILSSEQVQKGLDDLITNNQIIIEEEIDNPGTKCVYRKYYNHAENQIIDILKEMMASLTETYVSDTDINLSLSETGFTLDNKQMDAVKMALQNRISILSGGPGTGKTQTIKVIVDTFRKHYPEKKIQLCAPTGKASRRMSEVINLPAMTVHKKLNYIPFSEVELKDIDADLLIIDETSMMDIDLFYRVLTHISSNTSVLLVGDHNQLPSVGPGLILRDLIDTHAIPTTILTTVFRQAKGSNIADIAYKVLNNQPDEIPHYRLGDKSKHEDFIFLSTDSSLNIQENIVKYLRLLMNKGISTEQIQIITPANNGLLGVNGLNSIARDILNPYGKSKGEYYVSPTKNFYVGDRVLQTKNNYDLNVFNGSIGTILSIDKENASMIIDFDGTNKEYKHKDILDLKLGYAITVHKSQGSEFDYVLMPMVMEHSFVSNRNLLYTAITRAKKKFMLVGQDEALNSVCNNTYFFSRKSQIKSKLLAS